MDDEDGLPSFDYLKRFKRPKVENETVNNSVKKSLEEEQSSVARPGNKEIDFVTPNASNKAINEMPSTSGFQKKGKRKAGVVTRSKANSSDKKTSSDSENDYRSTLTGENPDNVDYKNLTRKQLEHLIKKLNRFHAANSQRNTKIRKRNRQNLFPRQRNTSSTFGKGQVGKAHDGFWDIETAWKRYDSRFDSLYREQERIAKEFEDEALNALLSQLDVPKEPEDHAVIVDEIDLTSHNGTVDLTSHNATVDLTSHNATVDLTSTLNSSVVINLDDSDEESNDATDSAPRVAALESGEENNGAVGSVPRVPALDSNDTKDTNMLASSTTGESSSTGKTSDHKTRSLGECPICFDNMATKKLGSMQCGHVFCMDCIEKSLKINSKCPTCRKTVKKKSVRALYL